MTYHLDIKMLEVPHIPPPKWLSGTCLPRLFYVSKVKTMRAFKIKPNIAIVPHAGSFSEAMNTSGFTSHLTSGGFQ